MFTQSCKMKRKKFLNTLILCFLIGNNLSEGLTAGKVREHLPFITAPPTYDGDHLNRFPLRGTKTDSTRSGFKLTPLLVEKTTDPPDSVYESGHQAESIKGGQDVAEEASQERSSKTRREIQSRFNLRLTGLGKSSVEDDKDGAEGATQETFSQTRKEPQPRDNLRLARLRESKRHVHDPKEIQQEDTNGSPRSAHGRNRMPETIVEDDNEEDGASEGSSSDSPEGRVNIRGREQNMSEEHGSSDSSTETDSNSETVTKTDSNEDGTSRQRSPGGDSDELRKPREKVQKEASRNFLTAMSLGDSLNSSVETDLNSEKNGENYGGEHGTSERASGGGLDGRRKLRVKAEKGSSRDLSTAMSPENSLNYSTETDRNLDETGENDGGEDGINERSSGGGLDEHRKPRTKAKEESSRHLSTTMSQEDSLKSSTETNRKSEKIGESDGGEDGTNERSSGGGLDGRRKPGVKAKEGPSRHFSSPLPQEDNFHPEDSSIGSDRKGAKIGKNENVEKRTREGSSGSGSDERRKLGMKAQEGSSRHFSTAMSQEDSLKPVGPSIEADRNEKAYGQSSIDEDNTRESTSRGGHGTDKSPSRGRSRMITHEGSSRNPSTVIPREHSRNRTDSFINTDRHSQTADENDDEEGSGSGEVSSGSGSEPVGPSRHVSTSASHGDSLNPPDSSNESDSNSEKIGENYNGEDGTGKGADEPPSRGSSRLTTLEGPSAVHDTSTVQHTSTTVRPDMQTASTEIRWSIHHQGELIETNRFKKKKKLGTEQDGGEDEDEEHVSPNTVAAIVVGLLAASMMLLAIGTSLWRRCKDNFLRRNRDAELGLVTPSMTNFGEELSDEEIIFERKPRGSRSETSSNTPQWNTNANGDVPCEQFETSGNHSTHAPAVWTITDTPRSTPLMTAFPATDTARITDLWMINETPSEMIHLLCPSGSSVMSEQSWMPPKEASLPAESEMWKYSRECHILPGSSKPSTSGSTLLASQSRNGFSTLAEKCSISVLTESSTSPNVPEQLIRSVSTETTITNSSAELSKTPVPPVSDVVITIEDEKYSKRALVCESYCSSGETIFPTENPDVDAKAAVNKDEGCKGFSEPTATDKGCESLMASGPCISSGEPPLPPPPMKPLSATTKLRQGKSLIGGRKALDNRRFIKHLTSGERSSGFQGDIEKAASKIMMYNGGLLGKSKEKRKVIKEQTKRTGKSIEESIVSAKSIIMNEKVDRVRDKKCASRRRVIHKARAPPADSTLRQHSSLKKEIAFAQSVILPGASQLKAERRIKERNKVINEMVHELKNPSFEERIQIAASTINLDERTRTLNARCFQKRKILRIDAETVKFQTNLSKFAWDIKFVRNVICGHTVIDHEQNPQMGCLCYYCKRHWQKTGRPPCFSVLRDIALTKDIALIDGKLYFLKSKTSASHPASGPNTSSLSNLVSVPGNSDID